MNWKFWEWFDKGEPTQTHILPVTEEKNVLVLEDPIAPVLSVDQVGELLQATNPEAERIRKQLLANRK